MHRNQHLLCRRAQNQTSSLPIGSIQSTAHQSYKILHKLHSSLVWQMRNQDAKLHTRLQMTVKKISKNRLMYTLLPAKANISSLISTEAIYIFFKSAGIEGWLQDWPKTTVEGSGFVFLINRQTVHVSLLSTLLNPFVLLKNNRRTGYSIFFQT